MACLLLGAIFGLQSAKAQLLDDSTKNVYGAHSTRFFYPEALLFATDSLQPIDTLLRGYDLLSVPERTDFAYVNLGSLGSATRQLFYSAPKQIGARSGLNAYSSYFVHPEKVPLYDTYSPYISAKVLFGGEGRSNLELIYSRNVTPVWNFGARFRRISIDKQIGPRQRDERQLLSTSYQLHTSAATRDSLYAFYVVFSRLHHESFDQGGSLFSLDDTPAARFAYRSATAALTDARSTLWRYGLQTLHRIRILSHTYLYIKGHIGKERFRFYDNLLGSDGSFYERKNISEEETNEYLSFGEENVEGGLLWRQYSGTYRCYLGRRWVNYAENDAPGLPQQRELYLGLSAEQSIALGHLSLAAKLLGSGHHQLRLGLRGRLGTAIASLSRYKPTSMSQSYFGNHHIWQQQYRSPKSATLQLLTSAPQLHKNLNLQTEGRISALQHYIYYGKQQMPLQLAPNRILLLGYAALSGRVAFFERHVFLETRLQLRRFLGSRHESFAFPTWHARSTLYYEGQWFKKSVRIQLGLRARWRSDYRGFAYQPALQQFYAQDAFLLRAYTPVDVFLRAKMKNFRIFMHFLHLNQASGSSYFATPYYLGEQRMFDIGLSLDLFD